MIKKEKTKVMPSMELLSEMEGLEIHGGAGGNQVGADDVNIYCVSAKCVAACNITDLPKTTTKCSTNIYCIVDSCVS